VPETSSKKRTHADVELSEAESDRIIEANRELGMIIALLSVFATY
jgi:hypothetical protein